MEISTECKLGDTTEKNINVAHDIDKRNIWKQQEDKDYLEFSMTTLIFFVNLRPRGAQDRGFLNAGVVSG